MARAVLAKLIYECVMKTPWIWLIGVPLALPLLITFSASFLDEPLKAYVERTLNEHLLAHTAHIGVLYLYPLTLSVDLEGVTLRQKEHPEPPTAATPRIRAALQWSSLLGGRLLWILVMEHSVIRYTRREADQRLESSPGQKHSWQDALFAMQEFQVSEVRVTDGDLTYWHNPQAKPIHVTQLHVRVKNIRNVRSGPREYPSHLHADAVVFEKGLFQLDGEADFLADPPWP